MLRSKGHPNNDTAIFVNPNPPHTSALSHGPRKSLSAIQFDLVLTWPYFEQVAKTFDVLKIVTPAYGAFDS